MTGVTGVNVVGFVSARLGLGVAARATIAALTAKGVPVAVADITLPDGRSGFDTSWAHLNIKDAHRLPFPVTLVHVNPPEAVGIWNQFPQWFANGRSAIVPFFELTEVPTSWVGHLSRYDAILAPTEHISASIRNAVSVPVLRFPLAAHVDRVVSADRAAIGIPAASFAFVTTWDSDSGLNRKNGIGVLRAFRELLRTRKDAVLVIKSNGIARHPELERELASIPSESVVVVDKYLSYSEVLALYAACDAFISLHRAEGLGLGLMEAMLLGKPIVATGWSGNMDFMDASSAALVKYTFAPVVDTQSAYSPANFHRRLYWAEPDLLDAVEQCRRLMEDRSWRERIAAAGQERARSYQAAFPDRAIAAIAQLDETRQA